MAKSRKQCVVRDEVTGKWRRVKAADVGKDVYDKKTHKQIGFLLEPNSNSGKLYMFDFDKKKSVLLE